MPYTKSADSLELPPTATMIDRAAAAEVMETLLDYLADIAGAADQHGWDDILRQVEAILNVAELHPIDSDV